MMFIFYRPIKVSPLTIQPLLLCTEIIAIFMARARTVLFYCEFLQKYQVLPAFGFLILLVQNKGYFGGAHSIVILILVGSLKSVTLLCCGH